MEELIIYNILQFGSIGSLAFFALLILFSKLGIFDAVRDPQGNFRKELNWKTIIGFGVFISLFVLVLYLGNQALIESLGQNLGFKIQWLNAFGIFMVIHLFDLIVIDYLIVVKWHPAFLNLPDTPYYTTMQAHLEGFVRGLFFGAGISFLVALL